MKAHVVLLLTAVFCALSAPALALNGAIDVPGPVEGGEAALGAVAPQTLDDEYARLAEGVPGFGGLYLDDRGTTHVYLKDLALAREVQGLGDHVEVHQGEYDFRDLLAWKKKLRPQLAQKGAVFLDIDERRNRLLFGLESGSLEAFSRELQSFLRETRIPLEAVLIEAAEPIVPLVQLTDKIRPVPAGVQIQSSAGNCTLGINATRQGVKGFVTASHCTAMQSKVEGTVFFQSTGAGGRIGAETVDPPFFFSGCPPGRVCRNSDAVFVAYDSTALSAKGEIANPSLCWLSQTTLTINPQLPLLPVAGFLLFSNPASNVVKVGRTTGCTIGAMMNTCADVNAPLPVTMLCQNRVSGVAARGDSGSPVFLLQGGAATLSGILWGGSSGTYVYSPWISVFTELGGNIFPDAP